MRQNIEKLTVYIIFLSVTIFLSSCITSSKDQDQRRLALYFLVQNIGDEIVIDEQILVVDEFKFALENFNLYAENDIILQTSDDVSALIYSYNKNIVNDRLILDVDLGIRDVDHFSGYELFVSPVRDRSGVLDSDFFGQQENYSVVIRGTVNDNEFNFRSSMEYGRKYEFSVDLNEEEETETLLIRNIIDIESVFTSSDGGLLDPNDPANEEKIFNNIHDLLIIQASAATIFDLP